MTATPSSSTRRTASSRSKRPPRPAEVLVVFSGPRRLPIGGGVKLLVAFVLVIAGVAFVRVRRQRRAERDRSIAILAESLHLTYSPLDLFDDIWQPFHFFGLGTTRGIENVLAGTVDDVEVRAFDYWYEQQDEGSFEVVEGRLRFTCGVVAVPASCPKLAVQPRTMTDDLIGLVGADVLPLELEEFNR